MSTNCGELATRLSEQTNWNVDLHWGAKSLLHSGGNQRRDRIRNYFLPLESKAEQENVHKTVSIWNL